MEPHVLSERTSSCRWEGSPVARSVGHLLYASAQGSVPGSAVSCTYGVCADKPFGLCRPRCPYSFKEHQLCLREGLGPHEKS